MLRMYLLGPKIEQIHKLRAVLGDFQSTPGRIKCPLLPQCSRCSRIGGVVGDKCEYCKTGNVRLWKMKNYLFQRRVAKLKRLEKQVKQIFERDMLKTYEVYKNAKTKDA